MWLSCPLSVSQHGHQTHFLDPNDSEIHTQNVENMWMRAKRKIKRQFGTSRELFPSYLHEFVFRNACHGRDIIHTLWCEWPRAMCPYKQKTTHSKNIITLTPVSHLNGEAKLHKTYINQSLTATLNTLIKSTRRNALVLLWIVNFPSRRHFYGISTSCFDVDPTCMQRTCARCEATFSYSSSEKLPYTSNVGNRLVSPAPFKTHIYVMQTSLHRQQFCLSVNLIAYHCHGSVKHVIQRSSG